MTAAELIKKLPQDANVGYIYDGGHGLDVDTAYLSKSGEVLLSAHGQEVYDDKDRPLNAPLSSDNRYWKVDVQ